MSTTTEQAVFDAAEELTRAGDALRIAVQAGKVAPVLRERLRVADLNWTKVRRGRLEAGQVAA